ncbi:hypothetical protein Tco_0479287 [Tanacetum coccineum]
MDSSSSPKGTTWYLFDPTPSGWCKTDAHSTDFGVEDLKSTPQGLLLTCPAPQPQTLGTTFKARVRDYMVAHTERMERFKNTIFKQREEINGRMTEMFGLLKELTASRTPKKVLIREEAKYPSTKEFRKAEALNGAENGTGIESVETPKNDEVVEAPGSQPVAYYLKHKINEKLIKGLVNNNRFNNSLSGTRVGKKNKKAYNVLPEGPVYDAILKKKIKERGHWEENF